MMLKDLSRFFVRNRYIILLVVFGSTTWFLTMVRSGLNGQFWGANAHDGIWHIALANSLARGSLEMPTFAGEALKNYHIGFDLLVAFISKITGIQSLNLYFQVLPIIFAIVTGLLTYIFVSKWRKSQSEARWATFFVYFGGSWAWIFGKQDSMFWSQQSITTLINPPYTLSLIFLLTALIFLHQYTKTSKFFYYLLTVIFFGLLSQIKVYAFVLSIGALFVLGIWKLVTEKRLNLLNVFVGTLSLGTAVFVPINSLSDGTLIFQPFWFLETMMLFPDRVGWINFYEAMKAYTARDEWIRASVAYAVAFVIFIVGNFGTRFLAIWQTIKDIKRWRKLESISIFIYLVIAAGIVLPMLFVQTGTAWNTIQFFYYSLFFSGVLAGIALAKIENKTFIVLMIVLLTVPTTLSELLAIYMTPRPSSSISQSELEALKFLNDQPDGVVLAYPTEHSKSTAYVSAYGNKPVYLEDEINLNIMGYDWQDRREKVVDYFEKSEESYDSTLINENDIEYLYILKGQDSTADFTRRNMERIFENNEVTIYKVK